MSDKFEFNPHGTTILAVRRQDGVAMGGDGQVTLGNTVMKGNARKVRRLFGDKVLAGFAGGTADAFTLFERFEGKLEKYGNLTRAAIELAKDWRSDRYLRRLEALLLVADPDKIFVISGNGDVIEPDHDVAADVTHLGELGSLHLDERRVGELGEPAVNLGLADAGRADHEDVLGRDFLAQRLADLHAAPAVAQGDRDGALGRILADDVLVQLLDDLSRREC